jgi:hypothetical protein
MNKARFQIPIMSGRNRYSRIALSLMVVTICLVLAVLWVVLAMPETALANTPSEMDYRKRPDLDKLHQIRVFLR